MYYLEGLNEAQKKAVLHTEGPLLILAGAGAGKTKTVTHRILHLIKKGVAPSAILAITFTNKAAREMRERVQHIIAKDHGAERISQNPESPFVSTFHALGVTILKEHARHIGLTRHFGIADRGDSLRLVKESLVALGMDPKQYEPGKILSVISREKGNMVSAEEFARRGNDARSYSLERIVGDVWLSYEKKLLEEKMLDFDDLLLKTYQILKKHDDVRAQYQNTWKYIHVDEYQDTNKVQYGITTLLAEKDQNLCVVGDIDQNIYSWRGADIQNILNFEKDYPGATVILLEENYRSTKTILAVANAVIKKNKMRREKNLFTQNAEGAKIGMYRAANEGDEANFIAQRAKDIIEKGGAPREMAVLYRANFQSRTLEEAFLNHNVPYQLLGTKFFERKEIKDIISFIRAGLNPEALGDVKRVINVPARGIGKVTLLKIFSGQKEVLSGSVREKVDGFYRLLGTIGDKARSEKPSAVVKFVIQASGLEKDLKDGTEEDAERLENMMELVSLATKYDKEAPGEGIERLLEEAALATDQDTLEKNENAVKLMTVHASKGLEFDTVFIAGLEEDLFPHERMGSRNSEADLEEERRLFYVALTRARKKLFLSHAEMRMIYGNTQMNIPSQFLGDIDAQYLEEEEGFAWTGKVVYLDL